MSRRNALFRHSTVAAESPPLVYKWLLRILVPLNGRKQLITSHGFNDDVIAEQIGLGDWIDCDDVKFDPAAVQRQLRQLHRAAERDLASVRAPACLRRNVDRLGQLVGLSEVDRRILEFAVLIQRDRLLDGTADYLGMMSSVTVVHVLSTLLNLPEPEIRAALSPYSVLSRSGLVTLECGCTTMLRGKLNLLSEQFADHIASSEVDPLSLLRGMVAPAAPGTLSMPDFEHIERSLDILRPYLRYAYGSARRGVNVLLHGDPGTGKNELTRALAAELGCELFEVASEDGGGAPISGERRLRAFRAAQSFFGQRRALLVFDEVEDVFNDGNFFIGHSSTAKASKAWINRVLEDNPVPTLWLTNSVCGLDNAFIRRFDMVIDLPIPPQKQRERIIQTACQNLLDADMVVRLAETEALAPAIITRAASVVQTIASDLGPRRVPAALQLLIDSTLQAQGHTPVRASAVSRLPEVYDPTFVNADADLASVAAGLAGHRMGRLCLYGPPGTGKTAYARWLAKMIGMPLMVRRASDILSKWLGEGEKNVARAFRDAEQASSILLIDEIDSFLQDRRGALRSWEVTLVNEMLTQMEAFPGIFIATTNLMEGLDQASLRRFDLKLRFAFLRPDQTWRLLQRHCAALSLVAPDATQRAITDRFCNITPGDFATVVRRHEFRPLASAAEFVTALISEAELKGGFSRAMGFC